VASFFLFGLGWLWATPPAGGVDEASHYVRIVGLAHGQLIGSDVEPNRPLAHLNERQLERVNAEAGRFRIPGRSPSPSECHVLDATQPFNCDQTPAVGGMIEEVSLHGRSLPGSYFIPSAFARLGDGMWSTLMLARFGMLLQNTMLFAVAVWALRNLQGEDKPPLSAAMMSLGLLVTPVLVFLAGTMSPSATEILSVGAFSVILVLAGRKQSGRLMWGAGVLAVWASWSRDLGALAVLVAGVSVALLEPDLRQCFRQAGARRWLPIGFGVLGVLTSQIWQSVMKHPLAPEYGSIGHVWRDIYLTVTTLRDAVGLGGWLNTRMDPFLEITWVSMWVLALAALLRGVSSLVRNVLSGQAIALVAISVFLIGSQRAGGFGTQGRYLLPFVAVFVIVLATASQEAPMTMRAVSRGDGALFGSFLVLGHGSAFLIAAHRHARGLAEPLDFSAALWAPPGGWVIAGLPFALGSVFLLASTMNLGTSEPQCPTVASA
jgi:hypothetical protein